MASKTKKTEYIRERKKATSGKKRKANLRKGTTKTAKALFKDQFFDFLIRRFDGSASKIALETKKPLGCSQRLFQFGLTAVYFQRAAGACQLEAALRRPPSS